MRCAGERDVCKVLAGGIQASMPSEGRNRLVDDANANADSRVSGRWQVAGSRSLHTWKALTGIKPGRAFHAPQRLPVSRAHHFTCGRAGSLVALDTRRRQQTPRRRSNLTRRTSPALTCSRRTSSPLPSSLSCSARPRFRNRINKLINKRHDFHLRMAQHLLQRQVELSNHTHLTVTWWDWDRAVGHVLCSRV